MTETISTKEARSRIASLLDGAGHVEEAKRMATSDYVSIEFPSDDIRADDASVYVSERRGDLIIGAGAERQLTCVYLVMINWRVTHRNVASARVGIDCADRLGGCLVNYQQAFLLAAKIEALVKSFPQVVYEEK